MRQRILIDGTKLLDPRTDGIKRYVIELLRAMHRYAPRDWTIDVSLDPGFTLPLAQIAGHLASPNPSFAGVVPRLLSPGPENPLHQIRDRVKQRAPRSVWSIIRDHMALQTFRTARSGIRRWQEFRRRGGHYDLVHLTLPNTWHHVAGLQTRLLATVHDLCHLVCPQFQAPANVHSLAAGLAFCEHRRANYIAVSNATRHQLMQKLHVNAERVRTVHEGVDHTRFTPHVSAAEQRRVRNRYHLGGAPFVLCVGTVEPRKNLTTAVRAFRRLTTDRRFADTRLVVAGNIGWGDHGELQHHMNQCAQIQRLGYVDELDLPVLYSLSTAFCYVSHYEGFGLPVAEAMSCGTPVIFSRTSSLPEVVGDGGLGVEPTDVRAVAAAMQAMLSDSRRRAQLASRALEQAERFDWQCAARETLDVYAHCLQQRTEHDELAQQAA